MLWFRTRNAATAAEAATRNAATAADAACGGFPAAVRAFPAASLGQEIVASTQHNTAYIERYEYF